MTYLEWITVAEKMKVFEYHRLPEYRKLKIRANYREYCELYNLETAPIKI